MTTLLAQTETVGNTAANIGIFSLFVVVTMVVVIRASKRNATAAEFFTGGRGFTGPQNGIAIARNEQSPQLLRLPMPAVSAEVAQ